MERRTLVTVRGQRESRRGCRIPVLREFAPEIKNRLVFSLK
jgi:hypothetical protein